MRRLPLLLALAACGGSSQRTPDDAALADAAPAPDAPDRVCGQADQPKATVAGDTPLGAFDGRYAWAGYTSDEGGCNGFPTIYIQAAPELHSMLGTWQGDGAVFTVQRDASFSLLGPRDVPVVVRLGGREATTTAHVELTRADPHTDPSPRVEGNITVTGGGWNLTGSFSTAHCALIDVHCI